MQNPEEYFYRALEVIPIQYEDEVVMKREIKTMGDIKEFVSHRSPQTSGPTTRSYPEPPPAIARLCTLD